MIEKSTIQWLLSFFFEHPSQEFHLRELSRILGLSMPTIVAATDTLSKERFILKTKGKVLTMVQANRESNDFVRYKRVHNLEQIYASGIVDYLSKAYRRPRALILFGSFSRGEDIEGSDIDIAVFTGKKQNLDLAKYERTLKRGIHIHQIDPANVSKEFKANLANGIVLEGSW